MQQYENIFLYNFIHKIIKINLNRWSIARILKIKNTLYKFIRQKMSHYQLSHYTPSILSYSKSLKV